MQKKQLSWLMAKHAPPMRQPWHRCVASPSPRITKQQPPVEFRQHAGAGESGKQINCPGGHIAGPLPTCAPAFIAVMLKLAATSGAA